MKKYKLIGVTKYAERHLSVDDLDTIKSMVGCDIIESEHRAEIDGGKLFIMPDGKDTHVDFLDIEEKTSA
jgi:hypothetical protein